MDGFTKLTEFSFKSKKNITWTFGDLIYRGSYGNIYLEGSEKEDIYIKTGKESVYFEIAVLRKLSSDFDSHIPKIIDSGKLLSLGLDIYFIVMPNYGNSLNYILELYSDESRVISQDLLNSMMTDMLFALSYLSSKKYMHLDVKPSNIVFDETKKNWYLIDYGLAKNFRNDKFEKDKKYINHGTPDYMARDAHRGIMSRKCDLESLVYTMLVAEDIDLPWKKLGTKNKKTLLIQKNSFFRKELNLLKIPEYQQKYIVEVDMLKPNDNPNYELFQSFFISKMKQKTRNLLIEKAMANLK